MLEEIKVRSNLSFFMTIGHPPILIDEFVITVSDKNDNQPSTHHFLLSNKTFVDVQAGKKVRVLESDSHILIFSGYEVRCLEQHNSTILRQLIDLPILAIDEWLIQANGYFSFVLINKIDGEIVIARDKLGAKPLYYQFNDEIITLANRLTNIPNSVNQTFDAVGLSESIHYRWMSGKETLIDTISQVPAACYVSISNMQCVNETRYWNWENACRITERPEMTEVVSALERGFDEYFEIISPQVKKVLIPLSGGVDSSVLAAKAAEHLGDKAVLGIIRFEGEHNPEYQTALYFAKALGLEVRVIEYKNEDVINDISLLVDKLEQLPRHFSSMPFAKLLNASDEFDGVIYGEPGDTLFGSGTINRLIKRLQKKKVSRYVPNLFVNYILKFLCPDTAKKFNELKNESIHSLFHTADKLSFDKNDEVVLLQLQKQMSDVLHIDEHLAINVDGNFLNQKKTDWLAQLKSYMLITDIVDHLITADHLIENRKMEILTPLSYSRVVEATRLISEKLYLGDSHVKVALRELGCKYYSRESMYAPKYGFNTPNEIWISVLRPSMEEKIAKGQLAQQSILTDVSAGTLSSLSQEMIWTLYHLEVFASKFNIQASANS